MKKDTDPTIRLLDTVWANANSAVAHSFERLNHAMRGALELAIGSGFQFSDKTLTAVASQYKFGYWCGADPEWIYTLAVAEGNITAAQSYEAWRSRKPFIADNVEFQSYHHKFAHMASGRQRSRLAVGFIFPWDGVRVTVTSFAKDGSSLVAVSYKEEPTNSYKRRIAKRYTITREAIQKARAEFSALKGRL